MHYVEEDDERTVSCNCPSGMHGVNVCWHMAAVLFVSGIVDAPKPSVLPEADIAAAAAFLADPLAALQS